MGQDKAGLLLNGLSLLEHGVALLREAGFYPVILGSPRSARANAILDAVPGLGPLAGLTGGLRSLIGSRQAAALFLPVDVPGITPMFLRWLWARAQTTGAGATVPLVNGRAEPLCAVYSVALAAGLGAALDRGERKVMRAVRHCTAPGALDLFRVEAVAPLAGWPAAAPWFQNINTPEDWAWMCHPAKPKAASLDQLR